MIFVAYMIKIWAHQRESLLENGYGEECVKLADAEITRLEGMLEVRASIEIDLEDSLR